MIMKRVVVVLIVICVAGMSYGQAKTPAGAPTTSESVDPVKVEEAYRALQQRQKKRRSGQYDSIEKGMARITELEKENARLREENGRFKSAVALLQKADKLQKEIIQIYQNQLAKFDPDFVARSLPQTPAIDVDSDVGRGAVAGRTDNGQAVREFIKTVSKDPNEPPEMTELMEQFDESVLKLVELGQMHIDPQSGTVRYSSTWWSKLSEEQKRTDVQMLSRFLIRHGRSGRVTVKSSEDDAELASYSASTGAVVRK
jgi:hypothetical protein